jgi:hypothetical protein
MNALVGCLTAHAKSHAQGGRTSSSPRTHAARMPAAFVPQRRAAPAMSVDGWQRPDRADAARVDGVRKPPRSAGLGRRRWPMAHPCCFPRDTFVDTGVSGRRDARDRVFSYASVQKCDWNRGAAVGVGIESSCLSFMAVPPMPSDPHTLRLVPEWSPPWLDNTPRPAPAECERGRCYGLGGSRAEKILAHRGLVGAGREAWTEGAFIITIATTALPIF